MSCLFSVFIGEVFSWEHESILPRLDATAEALQGVIALQDATGDALSWSELTSKSRALSHVLNSRLGGVSGSRVGLFQEPTVDWIVTMLAVWRCGASYVPLDLSQGLERLSTIAEDGRLAAIVVHEATMSSMEKLRLGPAVTVVNVSALGLAKASFLDPMIDPGALSDAKLKGGDEAMVLYTSGTTGQPKVGRGRKPYPFYSALPV